MTQPTAANAKLIDKTNNPQIGEQGSSITAAVAPTSIPAIATGAGVTQTTTAATDLTTTSAALAVLEDEVALIVVAVNALISALEAQGLIGDN